MHVVCVLPDAFCSTNSNCSLLVDHDLTVILLYLQILVDHDLTVMLLYLQTLVDHDLTVILLYLQILMSVSEGDARRDASTRLGLSPAPVVMASISREMGSLALVS